MRTTPWMVATLMLLGCEGPQGAQGPPGAAPSADEIARAVIAQPEFKKLLQEAAQGSPGGSGGGAPPTVAEGRAGETLSKIIVQKVSGTGYQPSTHLIDLTVQPPVFSEDGAKAPWNTASTASMAARCCSIAASRGNTTVWDRGGG